MILGSPLSPLENILRSVLAEAAETQGFDWLSERVDEVLSKAAA